MPYQWTSHPDSAAAPRWQLCAWPHRSLAPHGFVTFIGITAALMLVPLLAVLGSPVLWGLLPFVAGTVWLIWHFLQRSTADGTLREDLKLWPDRIELIRTNPRKPAQHWQANPYWVRIDLHETGGPVDQYLTLSGAGREVELGAFLSPQERQDLFNDLSDRLRRLDVNTREPPKSD